MGSYIAHVQQGRLAGGAGVVARGEQIFITVTVQEMPTIRDVAGHARCMDVLQTYRAVATRYILHALKRNKPHNKQIRKDF